MRKEVYMGKFQLQANETLIGIGMMAYEYNRSITRAPTRGTIYVTTQRVCYYESWSGIVYIDLSLSEIKGYNAKRLLFITYVYIYDKNNKCYTFSGFPAKKLQIWLKQIGIRKLS